MAGLCDKDLVELSLEDIKNSCGFGLDIGNYEVVYSKEVRVRVRVRFLQAHTTGISINQYKEKMEKKLDAK